MPSLIARAFKLGTRLTLKRYPTSTDALIRHMRQHMSHPPLPTVMPLGVKTEIFHEQGISGDRLCLKKPQQVILYLHGGGYICGSTRTYHNFCGRLAKALNAEVWLPDYRLAPEHPFPAAVEDALAIYQHLLNKGWRHDQITIAGDSAGAGLTLATLLAARDKQLPQPKCAVLLSPFADMRCNTASIRQNDKTDWMLSSGMLEVGRPLYAQTPADAVHPWASPVLADFTGLPPLFVTVCEEECLRDDAYGVQRQAQKAGVPVVMLSRQDLVHVWPIFVPLMPEAREDLTKIIRFIARHG